MFKKSPDCPLHLNFMLIANLQAGTQYEQKNPRLTGPANAREFDANFKVMPRFWDEGEMLI